MPVSDEWCYIKSKQEVQGGGVYKLLVTRGVT